MKSRFPVTALCLLLSLGSYDRVHAQEVDSKTLAPMPIPLTNNAVTTVVVADTEFVISFAGLASGKKYSDGVDFTYVLDSGSGRWSSAKPLPGGVGRLASAAVAVARKAYVFGGYTVADDGTEVSTPWVHAFDPVTGEFDQRQSMPVPVDDAVAVSYADRYVYLISGWHDDGNVNLVQLYDSQTDTWTQATPIPGKSVFGHAGGIVGKQIVYCDGVMISPNADKRRDFVANDECFLGIIDAADNRRIDWRTLERHPGPPRYRMASAGMPQRNAILFFGGSDNPYNYDGIGYDGQPAQPSAGALLYDLESQAWRQLEQPNAPSMDHRALVPYAGGWLTVGGMLAGQKVTDRVTLYTLKGY